MSALRDVVLGGAPEPWVALGLTLGPDSTTIRIGSVACRFDLDSAGAVRSLGVAGLGRAVEVDGLSFTPEVIPEVAAEPAGPAGPVSGPTVVAHACGATMIDHIVVMTSSLDRTCTAVAAMLGAPLRRIRDAAPGVRQGFHRLGEVILEVVETPQVTSHHASFWGLVVVVEDLERWAAALGPDLVSPPNRAVQPGRRIANVRSAAGLGFPVAFMSPEPELTGPTEPGASVPPPRS